MQRKHNSRRNNALKIQKIFKISEIKKLPLRLFFRIAVNPLLDYTQVLYPLRASRWFFILLKLVKRQGVVFINQILSGNVKSTVLIIFSEYIFESIVIIHENLFVTSDAHSVFHSVFDFICIFGEIFTRFILISSGIIDGKIITALAENKIFAVFKRYARRKFNGLIAVLNGNKNI